MMILSLIFVSSYSEFNPKVTKTMSTNDNLWNVLSSTSSDGDALITVKEGIYSTSQWANIGSFVTGLSVKGTLKIKGEGKVIVDGGFNTPSKGITREDNIPSSATLNMKMIDVYQSENIQFINCIFRHAFCRAISFYECKNCVIKQCLVEDFGGDGIVFGNSQGTLIENNIVRHGGRFIHDENGIYDNPDPGAQIRHNDISDMFWDGINCWMDDKTGITMTIEKNHVHHIGFNLLDDIGCIYVTNANSGITIQNNYVHNAGCHNYGAWGIYVDLNCNGVVVQNNLAHDFYDGCIHFHYGFNNEVKNNILGFGKLGLMSKGQDNSGTMVKIYNNIFITKEGNFYCDYWGKNSFESYNNLYWDFGKSIQWFRNNDGKENTGTYKDPKFKDPKNRDFTFADKLNANSIGFTEFDYSDCGVYGSSDWRSVAESYVIEDFPEKSTDDSKLISSEKMYPDYDNTPPVETPTLKIPDTYTFQFESKIPETHTFQFEFENSSPGEIGETSNTFGGDDNQNTNWFTKERTIYISVIAVVVVVIITVAISCFIYNKNKSNKDEDSNLEVYA